MTMQAAIGGASAAAQGIASAMGGPNVSSASAKARFDNSGWTVATSRASARASDNRAESMGPGAPDPWGWLKWAALAVVGVAAIKMMTKG